ncbi:MAG: M56 family metallopeptidase [Chitinophagaceae bacterium]|nr:MAG: M56 family metallopeptidase [Chitinophagaceae bacterium]
MPINSFISVFGWSLIHSLWQAAIIFLALYGSLRIFRQAPSRMKYLLAYSAMAGIFLCFLLTFYSLWKDQQNMQLIAVAGAGDSLSAEAIKGWTLSPKSSGYNLWQPAMWIDYFVLLYCAGLIFFIGKVTRDFFVMRHIRHARIKPFDKAWEHYLDKLRTACHITRRVKLFLSEYLDVPVVIGYLKPVIYLPLTVATHLTPEQIEAILLHELAHIRRYDFIANVFQTFIETVLFFNPFVWMISKIIRRERENCCDDLVLAATQPALYAETLLALAENQLYKGTFVLAAAGRKQQLFHRIKRMMEMKTKKLNMMQKLLVIFILAAGLLSVSWLTPGKKEDHTRDTKTARLKSRIVSDVRQGADTMILPASPVPAPAPESAHPAVPVPPAPPVSVPTPPLAVAASVDTSPVRFWNDSAVHHMQHQMQQYFSSDAWKKYQQDLQDYGQHIQQYFQSREGKEYQLELQRLRRQMNKMKMSFDSSARWKADREALRAEANKMREMFNNNPEWKRSMDSFHRQLARDRFSMDTLMSKNRIKFSFDKAKMDSLMAQAKKSLAWERMHHPRMFLFSSGHAVNPSELVRMMEEDGLIKNDHNYSIRINEKGLYIDGKKQSRDYFEKYRNLVGDHTNVEIRKKGGHLETSIHTDEEENTVNL